MSSTVLTTGMGDIALLVGEVSKAGICSVIVIDDELVAEAQRLTGISTKRGFVKSCGTGALWHHVRSRWWHGWADERLRVTGPLQILGPTTARVDIRC